MCFKRENIVKFIDFLFNNEALLIYLLILIVFLNIILFNNNSTKLLLLNLIVIAAYFCLTNNKNKNVILIASINFAIWGTIIEALVIKYSNLTLRYKNTMNNLYVPSWLFTIYIIFSIGAIFTFEAFKILID